MPVTVCTCCRCERTALHAHGRACSKQVKAAVLAAYRARGGVALDLALRAYGEIV